MTVITPHGVGRSEIGDRKELAMTREQFRKVVFWFGWSILIALPILFTVEIVMLQDLPRIQPWKWAILPGAALIIYLARNRDDVLRHHVV